MTLAKILPIFKTLSREISSQVESVSIQRGYFQNIPTNAYRLSEAFEQDNVDRYRDGDWITFALHEMMDI